MTTDLKSRLRRAEEASRRRGLEAAKRDARMALVREMRGETLTVTSGDPRVRPAIAAPLGTLVGAEPGRLIDIRIIPGAPYELSRALIAVDGVAVDRWAFSSTDLAA